MANNLENRDAYLIYGVKNDGEVVGFREGVARKNQNEVITFLKDKKVNGGMRPDVRLENIARQ